MRIRMPLKEERSPQAAEVKQTVMQSCFYHLKKIGYLFCIPFQLKNEDEVYWSVVLNLTSINTIINKFRMDNNIIIQQNFQ